MNTRIIASSFALLGLLSLVSSRSASAQEVTASSPPEIAAAPALAPAPLMHDTRWYGWETLIADGSALGIASVSFATSKNASSVIPDAAGIASESVFALGAPAVHLAHGHPVKAAADLGMRLAMPALFAFIGYEVAPKNGLAGWQQIGNVVDGFFVGCVAASVLDAAVLAREDAPALVAEHDRVGSAEPAPAEAPKPRWTPTLSVTPKGGSVGLAATF